LIPADVEQPAWVGHSKGLCPVIAAVNGLISVEGLIAGAADLLKPHSPDWFSPVCLTYPYEPEARCPQFLAFLDQVLEHDQERIALVQEWYGYCLTPDTTLQKLLIVVGEGANGKSAFADTLAALLGHDNVSHVPLELFGERFQLTATLGKLANIATEIGDIDGAAEGTLKAYTSVLRSQECGRHQCPSLSSTGLHH
jgi:putative DNA primase/helicase